MFFWKPKANGLKQEQFVPKRSTGLSLDPGRGVNYDGVTEVIRVVEEEKEEEKKFLRAHRPIKGNTSDPRGPKNETILRTIPWMKNSSN